MAYIICEPCVGTKDTACVDACPVDCIHPKKDEPEFEAATMLYIHPEECIDCGACEPACPVTAIFPEDNVPEQWQNYIPMNYEHYGIAKSKKENLPKKGTKITKRGIDSHCESCAIFCLI